MDNEQLAIRDFLAALHPFDQLPADALDALVEKLDSRSVEPGACLLDPGEPNQHLHIIRSGAVEVHDRHGTLLARLGEGDVFGQRSLTADGRAETRATALERTLVYRMPAETYHELCRTQPQFQYFLAPSGADRLRGAVQNLPHGGGPAVALMTTPVAQLARRTPVSVAPEASIREAAQTMTRERVSSLLVMEGDRLAGIVTDRDLRSRVIATGLGIARPVAEIMTPDPSAIAAGSYAYEALLAMAHSGYHHLPIKDGDKVIGMITDTDLLQRQSTSPLYVLGQIYKAPSVDALVRAGQGLAPLLVTLVQANASAHSVGHVVSSVGGAITCRLIALAEAELGPPPVPYAWLACGSLARYEQTARSDQDNALLLDDSYDAKVHGEYFESLARIVCDGLDACGYEYCPGEVMAVTPRWRQPLAAWKRYFEQWIDQPEPKALMHSSIFFDLRALCGDMALFQRLQSYVADKARSNRIFHAYMAKNAMAHQPPLGFFRNFVLVKDGEHDRTLDLKHRGVVPIIDVARVYALTGGVTAVNTAERLTAAQSLGLMSQGGAEDLRDALEFISAVRLRHQARRIQEGGSADNYLSPRHLSHFERNHLKDAFSVVSTIQSAMANRYQTARFG